MKKFFPAHIAEQNGKRTIQTLREHSVNTANYAREKLTGIGLGNTAFLAGIIHDMGKYTEKFSDYITSAADGEKVVRGSVNHTFCALVYLLERYHKDKQQSFETITCEILAYAVGSHHGEFDCISPDGKSGFEYRMDKSREEICYEEAVHNYFLDCADEEEIDRMFSLAVAEIAALFNTVKEMAQSKKSAVCFLVGMTARLILSSLTDADRRDTAEFMRGEKFSYISADKTNWNECKDRFDKTIEGFDTSTPINEARHYFSDRCRTAAKKAHSGIYTLGLPTGSGKTLSSLGYALENAECFSKKRIIFVIPLLSILEQNSRVIREGVGNSVPITEHHSNFVKDFSDSEELDRYELLSSTWESPIIITTLVQLLNTLFSDKISSVRRMSALCESVIIIDEIQSLPQKTMSMFNMAANFLAYCCKATVVLSSATQPRLDALNNKIFYSEESDIVPFEHKYFDVFKRTRIIDRTTPYGMSAEEFSEFVREKSEDVTSLLVICNTKNSALKLYKDLSYYDTELYHLSASMCMKHRCDILNEINKALSEKKKIICVSTQLVEAGVDFSFERVIRVEAGLDSISQAAGRCNRSNDFGGICEVYVVNLKSGVENLKMLKEIMTAQRCTAQVLSDYEKNPEKYDDDLLGKRGIETYYDYLMKDPETKYILDYPVKLQEGRTIKLFELLCANSESLERTRLTDAYFLNQSFKSAGEYFEVFDENTTDVIVPYDDEAKKIISDLLSDHARFDYNFLKEKVEQAKPYVIRLFEYQRRKLADDGMLYSDKEGYFMALNPLCYNSTTGLEINNFII